MSKYIWMNTLTQRSTRKRNITSAVLAVAMLAACFAAGCQDVSSEPVPSATPAIAPSATAPAEQTPQQTLTPMPEPTPTPPEELTAEQLLPFKKIPLDFTYDATGTRYNDFQVDSAGNLYVIEPIVKNSAEKDPAKWEVSQMRIRKYDANFKLLKEYTCGSGYPNLCTPDGIWVYQTRGSMLIKYDETGKAVHQQTVPVATSGTYQEILATSHYVCLRQDLTGKGMGYTIVDQKTRKSVVYNTSELKPEDQATLNTWDFIPYQGDTIIAIDEHNIPNKSTESKYDVIDCRTGQIIKTLSGYSNSNAAYDAKTKTFYIRAAKWIYSLNEETGEIKPAADFPIEGDFFNVFVGGNTLYFWNGKMLLALDKSTPAA